MNISRSTIYPNLTFTTHPKFANLNIGESVDLCSTQKGRINDRSNRDLIGKRINRRDLSEEPRVNLRSRMDLFNAGT